mgnify:CR=1 FL=1
MHLKQYIKNLRVQPWGELNQKYLAAQRQMIARHIFDSRECYDGIVITHGTDTMAYTASVLSFMLRGPVVSIKIRFFIPVPRSAGPLRSQRSFAAALNYPALLKIYLERISVANLTFGYNDKGERNGGPASGFGTSPPVHRR